MVVNSHALTAADTSGGATVVGNVSNRYLQISINKTSQFIWMKTKCNTMGHFIFC